MDLIDDEVKRQKLLRKGHTRTNDQQLIQKMLKYTHIETSDVAIITTVMVGALTFLFRKPISKLFGGGKDQPYSLSSSGSSDTGLNGKPSSSMNGNGAVAGQLGPDRSTCGRQMKEGNKNVVIFFGSQTGTMKISLQLIGTRSSGTRS